MNSTVLLVCLLASVPVVNGFYLFFPQVNDRIMALEVADQAAAHVPNFVPDDLAIDPEEAVMAAKRAQKSSLQRRSPDSYNCPCLHKVCTYHCMTK